MRKLEGQQLLKIIIARLAIIPTFGTLVVNIGFGLGNGTKPSPEPMLTQNYVPMLSLGHNVLSC